MNFSIAVPYLGVLVASLAAFVLGSLWYSPLLFGNVWMKLAGIKKSKKAKLMWLRFLVYFIGQFVMAFVLFYVLYTFNVGNYLAGLQVAFFMWLGFIAPITLGGVLWENKSIKLFLLNSAYNLVSLGLMSAILIAMK